MHGLVVGEGEDESDIESGDGSEESESSGLLYEADSDGVQRRQLAAPQRMPTSCSEQWGGVQGNLLLEKGEILEKTSNILKKINNSYGWFMV